MSQQYRQFAITNPRTMVRPKPAERPVMRCANVRCRQPMPQGDVGMICPDCREATR